MFKLIIGYLLDKLICWYAVTQTTIIGWK